LDWNELAMELQKEVSGQVLTREPMARHTTWRVGGPADLLVIPDTIKDLSATFSFAADHALPVTVLGRGSNVLVRDGGIRGIVVKMFRGLTSMTIIGEDVVAEAGCYLPFLARAAAVHGLSGLEFAAGIPGTVGGAVVMNAGAHGDSMGDVLVQVEVMDSSGNLTRVPAGLLQLGYRTSRLMDTGETVVKVYLRLRRDEPVEIRKRMQANLARRRALQPLNMPNAGSVFKNPANASAGQLIDRCGAKGLTVGGAAVSEKHANFIVNKGRATATDIITLMEMVRRIVWDTFQVHLEPEIHIMGEG